MRRGPHGWHRGTGHGGWMRHCGWGRAGHRGRWSSGSGHRSCGRTRRSASVLSWLGNRARARYDRTNPENCYKAKAARKHDRTPLSYGRPSTQRASAGFVRMDNPPIRACGPRPRAQLRTRPGRQRCMGSAGVANPARRANQLGLPESGQALETKIFLFTRILICVIDPPSPCHQRDVSRSSRNVARVAMDACGVRRDFSRRTKTLQRTAKSCGPGAATLASIHAALWWRGNGDNKGRSPGRARSKP